MGLVGSYMIGSAVDAVYGSACSVGREGMSSWPSLVGNPVEPLQTQFRSILTYQRERWSDDSDIAGIALSHSCPPMHDVHTLGGKKNTPKCHGSGRSALLIPTDEWTKGDGDGMG